jgi:hypothetical protein
MARTITPAQHLATLRAAERVAKIKGMHAEAKQVRELIAETERLISA